MSSGYKCIPKRRSHGRQDSMYMNETNGASRAVIDGRIAKNRGLKLGTYTMCMGREYTRRDDNMDEG